MTNAEYGQWLFVASDVETYILQVYIATLEESEIRKGDVQ